MVSTDQLLPVTCPNCEADAQARDSKARVGPAVYHKVRASETKGIRTVFYESDCAHRNRVIVRKIVGGGR